jgi:hypothetical protein
MSSLQKFHRRTNGGAPAVKLIGSEAPVAGAGFYLGKAGDGTSYMYVAPKSTAPVNKPWGSQGTTRGTVSVTNGLANTNTLYAFGSAAHPAAYYCKSLTTGGYNTWYLPAINELVTMFTNKSQTPFATNDAFTATAHICSTEVTANNCQGVSFQSSGVPDEYSKSNGAYSSRAVRRSTV